MSSSKWFGQRVGRRAILPALALLALGLAGSSVADSQVNVTTYHNDIGRTGQNLNETTLNLSNVNPTQFGKLFAQPVDGLIYAQPLYLSGITIGGATHNVVYVATEHDSVYAFDADSNGGVDASPLWQASMLSAAHGAAAGATTLPSTILSTDIYPEVGITGTPVIDPTTGTLYVVSKTMESNVAIQRLHALDVTSGAEKFGGPVVVTATVPGTGSGSVKGTLTFDSLWENQRPGLLLLNGIVYVGFAAHGDNGPWHGWILGYNAATLAQTGAYCASPNGTGSGFWMSGAGLAADQINPATKPFGRMFLASGNGDYNASIPYTNSMDYGDTHLALDLTNGVPTVTDEFTTNQQATLNSEDGDVGSGGLIVLPTQSGTNPHLAVQAGKAGTLFLLNRDNLGGYNTTTDQVLQEQPYSVGTVGVWSTPAYFNGTVYYWGRFDNLKAFPLVNGLLSTTPTKSVESYGYPGATPSISANGTSQGIVWSINSAAFANTIPGPSVLQAHQASNVATMLYSSSTNAGRDSAGVAVKFTVPTIANGKVYVGTSTELDIYGLLAGVTQTSAPVITPGTESYIGTVTVTITDSTPGSTIYYTTNGSSATTGSTVYTGPITVTSTETINAIAGASGLVTSAQTSATFTNISEAATVVFSLPTGTYGSAQTLTLADTTANSSIYYTTDGSTPTTASTLYTGPITVGSTETITAVAIAPGLSYSPVLGQTYTIILGATGISFSQGFSASAGLIKLNGSAQLNDSRLQLTDGLAGEAGSAWYNTPVNIQNFTSDFTFQLSNPVANGFTFAIQNAPQKTSAIGGNASYLAYAPISNSIAIKFDLYNSAGEGTDSTGLYLNGAVPTVPAIDLTATGINLHSDDAIAVHLAYNGTTLTMTLTDMVTAAVWSTSWTINIPSTIGSNTAYVGFTGSTGGATASQKILTWSFLSSVAPTTVATPIFSVATGIYTTTQSVSIADSTSGATIYYTTNGSTPTTGSNQYVGPISVSSTETLQAIAVATGLTNSAVASATYTITPPAATPTFSVAPGTYTSVQSVLISDTTAGATIYYTTNGATPTTSSTLYSGAITVSTSETLKAIAVATGYSTSATGSAAYVIGLPAATPTFSVGTGTYSSAQSVTLSDATAGATIYYTTNSTTPTTSSSVYSGPITVSTSETIEAIAVATGYSMSATASAAYVINLPTAAPVFSVGTGTYSSAQTVSLSDATAGAVIYYTTNGTTPTTSSTVYSGAITVSASETIEAIAVASGHANSAVSTAVYTINSSATTATPTFNLPTGTYNVEPVITISDATPGAVIHYSIDGVPATTASAVYTGPITLLQTRTVSALAVAPGSAVSATTSALYTLVAATPVISPAAGTYSAPLTVTLTTATPTATIFYTTNGTLPNASSMKYSGPIIIGASQHITAETIQTGFTTSSAVGNYYIITGGTAAPTFSVAGGTYTSAQTVTISDATAGATINYTTNGTTPTTASPVYSGPITISSTETLKAVATTSSLGTGAVTSAVYTIAPPAAAPVFSVAAGTYPTTQTVTITDATSGATIYYTTDGTTPTASSTVYSGPISVSATETLQAIAKATGYSTSAVTSAAYVIGTPVVNFPATFTATGMNLNGAKIINNALQLTDGGAAEARTAWFTTPVNVQAFTTDFNFQQTSASADGFTFTIQNSAKGINAMGGNGAALGYAGIPSSVAVKFDLYSNAGEGPDSTGFYTNGATPTVPAIDMSASPINLHSGDVMHAHITYDGTTLTLTITDTITNGTFTTSTAINIPATVGANSAYVGFTGATGGLTSIQNILNWTYLVN